jgi:hypothetical protein
MKLDGRHTLFALIGALPVSVQISRCSDSQPLKLPTSADKAHAEVDVAICDAFIIPRQLDVAHSCLEYRTSSQNLSNRVFSVMTLVRFRLLPASAGLSGSDTKD